MPNEDEQRDNGATVFWHRAPGCIRSEHYGVFEGGGAKGVAYAGALEVLAKHGRWFRAVAGASAGAITAALVAAGVEPEAFRELTGEALKKLKVSRTRGVLGLYGRGGYFPAKPLRSWLDKTIGSRLPGTPENVTFLELYEATGIELNIVAANISFQQQILFSHWETPKCAVADAVIASAAIPFAFEAPLLEANIGDGQGPAHLTIVDGGVWSNFPLFVFSDAGFRKYHGREPVHIDKSEILGFMLAETEIPKPDLRREKNLKFAVNPKPIRAWERCGQNGLDNRDKNASVAQILASVLIRPAALLAKITDWIWKREPGRWPEPRSNVARDAVQILDSTLGFLTTAGVLLPCGIVVALGGLLAYGVYRVVGEAIVSGANAASLLTSPGVASFLLPTVLALLVAPAILLTAAAAGAAGFLLYPAARRVMYGLATTYVSGAGATPWVAESCKLIALPIPPEIDTLSFEMDPAAAKKLIEAAKKATERAMAS